MKTIGRQLCRIVNLFDPTEPADDDCSEIRQLCLDRAGDHPDMTEELAEVLSTPHVEVVHRTEHEVNVR